MINCIEEADSGVVYTVRNTEREIVVRRMMFCVDALTLAREKLATVNLTDGLILSPKDTQVRLTKEQYDMLAHNRPNLLKVIFKYETPESQVPHARMPDYVERWNKDRWWPGAKEYIWHFIKCGYTLDVGIEWDYESYDHEMSYEYINFKHPFIGDLVNTYRDARTKIIEKWL